MYIDSVKYLLILKKAYAINSEVNDETKV